MDNGKKVVFNIDDKKFASDILLVQSIEEFDRVKTIKNPPKHIMGIIDVRGSTIPVYSLRERLGFEEIPKDGNTKLLMVESHGMLIAYKVDDMEAIIEVTSDDIFDTPPILRGEETDYIEKILHSKDDLIILIDFDKIVSDEDIERAKYILKVVENQKRILAEKKERKEKEKQEAESKKVESKKGDKKPNKPNARKKQNEEKN